MSDTKSIYKKMILVMKDVGPVTKDGVNSAQGYKFRGIDQFVNALHPALIKHGVLMVPAATSVATEIRDVVRSNGKAGVDKHVSLQMKYTFYAEDGSSVEVGPVPSEGLDSGDKATNKALSAALKYALIQTFTVPTEDMAEADLDTPEIGTRPGKDSPQKSVAASPSVAAPSAGLATPPASSTSTVAAQTAPTAPRRSTSFKNRPAAAATTAKPVANGATKAVDEWA